MKTPYILLSKLAGWQPALLDHVQLADQGATLRLRMLPGAVRPLTDAEGTLGGLVNPAGLAIDEQDRIYIADATANLIKRFDPCIQKFQTLPCIGGTGNRPRELKEPRGLAVSPANDLIAADSGNSRVQVFSIKGLALRAILGPFQVTGSRDSVAIKNVPAHSSSQPEKTWKPVDVAVSRSCWLYVTDYANGLIHVFDAHHCWRGAFDGASENSAALQKPTRLALDGKGRIYVVQEGADAVTVLDSKGKFLTTIAAPQDAQGRFCPVAIAIDADDNLHLSDRFSRQLFQFQVNDSGACCCISRTKETTPAVVDLLFDRWGNPVLASAGQIHQMTGKAMFESEGTFVTEALDSRMYRCPWHRVVMRGAISAGTQIAVECLTAEEIKTAAEIASLEDSRWTPSAVNSGVGEGEWDCLVQSPPGRYLWLRLKFNSDGKSSPCVDQLRIYYPRASSLQYLPAVYSQDEPSRQFLDEFLSIFDTMWATIGSKFSRIASYFDPMATPADPLKAGGTDFLSWLASWLGLSLDRHWPESRRRLLLKNAWRLYNLRGTPEGLRLHVQLYTGAEAQILEHFKLRRWLYVNHARLGEQTVLFGKEIVNRLQLNVNSQLGQAQLIDTGDPRVDTFNKEAHQFTVFVPQRCANPADPQAEVLQRQTLERIIEMAKPAHTLGHLQFVRPRFRIGIQSFIGKDTVVGAYPSQVVEGKSKLGYDSAISSSVDERRPPEMRVGKTTRIGSTTLMN